MINNPEWLFKCSEVCELLYGVYPLEILKSLYALKENDELNIKDINELFIETSIPYQVQDEIYDDYQKLGYKKGELPVTEEYAGRILRLPLYADMTEEENNYVIDKIIEFCKRKGR